MKRALASVLFVALLLGASACTSSDPDDGEGSAANGGASGSGGAAAANAQSGTGATSGAGGAAADGSVGGSAGTSAGASAGGSGGSGGSAGANASGGSGEAGASAGAGGEPAGECDLECEADQHCELMEVTCIQAPCNPVPTCIDGAAGEACGSRGLGACAEGSFCDFPAGANCGRSDALGTCAIKPGGCTFEYNPVCGCDGTTYGTACAAHNAGVSVESEGECDGDPTALHDCKLDAIACDSLPPECDEGQAPTQVGGCYGPCVPIEQCACGGPSDCPDEAHYTCHMSAGHCGPYV